MKNWQKVLTILGISFLAFIIEAGVPILIFVLLMYFEFVFKKKIFFQK